MRRTAPPPTTTPLTELSQKPAPPPLAKALERNYPPEARSQGLAGEAKVRARIDPNGRVGVARVTSESSHGFGAACQTTLLASAWTPPLDREGKPSTTWVTYRCKFRIED
jgi:TonB family protein